MVTAAPPSKVAGSLRSDDDKAGTPLAGLSCSCWVLHKPIDKSSACEAENARPSSIYLPPRRRDGAGDRAGTAASRDQIEPWTLGEETSPCRSSKSGSGCRAGFPFGERDRHGGAP